MGRFSVVATGTALFVLLSTSSQATDLFVGGAWDGLENNGLVSTDLLSNRETEAIDLPVSFTAGVDVLRDSGLTIDYTVPALGMTALDIDYSVSAWDETSASFANVSNTEDTYGSYATSFMGGQFGVFGGVKDQQSTFSMELTTSRTVGASLGYGGFYLSGVYQDAGPDGLLDGRRAWQAGLGYGSGDFDVRLTYVESAFMQGSPTELEGKQWMIGGLMQVTPSILLNANAYIVDRELAMPTVEPPGTGARVGVQLRF